MKAYDHTILLAHGSTDPRWAKPFKAIVAKASSQHDNVSLAYMELSVPSLDDAVFAATQSGAKHIAVLPLFFSTGRHLRKDVPAMLEDISASSEATIELLAPIGENPVFQQAITDVVGNLLQENQGHHGV